MNKELGTKWFTFFTKVRPWIVCFFTLIALIEFAQYTGVYLSHVGLLISLLFTIIQAGLSIGTAIKAEEDYASFVRFVRGVLIFEVISMAYRFGVEKYYEEGADLIYFLVAIAIFFLVWYLPNMKYFKKRLY